MCHIVLYQTDFINLLVMQQKQRQLNFSMKVAPAVAFIDYNIQNLATLQ